MIDSMLYNDRSSVFPELLTGILPALHVPLTPENSTMHYKNTPIQMYWKIHHQNMNIFR